VNFRGPNCSCITLMLLGGNNTDNTDRKTRKHNAKLTHNPNANPTPKPNSNQMSLTIITCRDVASTTITTPLSSLEPIRFTLASSTCSVESLFILKMIDTTLFYKRQNLKVYNDVQGRLYGCHTTKTAKIKKEGDNTLQYIARMSM